MTFRPARLADSTAIADLHTDNWQRHYRGAMPDDYLDDEAPTERRTYWFDRLRDNGDTAQTTVLYGEDGTLLGFCCIEPNAYPLERAYYLDNLHVAHEYRGKGLGRQLMQAAAARLLDAWPDGEIFLWVLTGNAAAIGFYDKLGGQRSKRKMVELAGNEVEVLMMRWRLSEMAAW